MVHSIPEQYRLPFFEFDQALRRAFTVSACIGIAVLLIVIIAPRRDEAITEVEQVPERFARLILNDAKPKTADPAPAAVKTEMEKPKAEATPPPPPRTRRQPTPTPMPVDAGKIGREKARKEISASLEGASKTAESAIQTLASSLGKTPSTDRTRPRARRGSVRGGRGGNEIAKVDAPESGAGLSADIAGSGLSGASLQIEAITPVQDGSGSEGGGGGAGANPYRSNASLLAVVKRYAPGIQFCYDNELKRSPGIRGKIVTALTVAASGKVTDVTMVTDTVGSAALRNCVLDQIREWKFPAVPEGTTVFRTPFVFTPPQD